jgi:acyl-CoA dehydrogenase
MWDFCTEPEFQEKLDWMAAFVRDECEPLDLLFPRPGDPYDVQNKASRAILAPLREKVKEQGLWACHLGPELGGQGFGQLKLALMNEILGRSQWAPTVFGTAAPDTGNAEILALYGTEEQKARYLQPLLEGNIVSTFSMTEPQGGSDPKEFVCKATRDGDEWVIDGEKWFSSHARYASFFIVMVVTNPDAKPYERMSMLIVPAETPGIEIIRNVATMNERDDLDEGTEGYIRYNQVRVPLDAMLGAPGEGFKVAQSRLGGGRVHHAMRVVGKCQRAFDMMCERALSRQTQGEVLAKKQMVQDAIAESWIQLLQFRLQVLHAAWTIDQVGGHKSRTEIAGVKVATPKVMHDVVYRAMHIHGALGVSNEMPFAGMWLAAPIMGIADGPTEVHKVTIARQVLKRYQPYEGLFPPSHLPERRAEARAKFAHMLDLEVGNL